MYSKIAEQLSFRAGREAGVDSIWCLLADCLQSQSERRAKGQRHQITVYFENSVCADVSISRFGQSNPSPGKITREKERKRKSCLLCALRTRSSMQGASESLTRKRASAHAALWGCHRYFVSWRAATRCCHIQLISPPRQKSCIK